MAVWLTYLIVMILLLIESNDRRRCTFSGALGLRILPTSGFCPGATTPTTTVFTECVPRLLFHLCALQKTPENAPSLHVISCMKGYVSVIAAAWLRVTQHIPHGIYTIRWHSSHRSSQSAKQLVTSFTRIVWLAVAIYWPFSGPRMVESW